MLELLSKFIITKIPNFLFRYFYNRIGYQKNYLIYEKYLDDFENWEQVSYYPDERWIYKNNNSFLIEVVAESREFGEDWTNWFPDKKAFAKKIKLKLNQELVVKPFEMIWADGGRYILPLPKIGIAFDERYFYWNENSIEFKVYKIIGTAYLYQTLEDLSKYCPVKYVK